MGKRLSSAQKTSAERLEELNNKIISIASNFQERPETISNYLQFSSHFYSYSTRNNLLVYNQNPNATFYQSFLDWKKLGYSVKSGEKGLAIYFPQNITYIRDTDTGQFKPLYSATNTEKAAYKNGTLESKKILRFSIGNVFDISQTTCPIEKYPDFYYMGHKDTNHKDLTNGLVEYCNESLGFDVRTENLQSISLRGDCWPTRKLIRLNELLEDTERLSTLIHETGHAVMHSSAQLSEKPLSQIEFEADAFSFMLQEDFGIPVTEARKRHLSGHFQKLLEEHPNTNIINVLSDVRELYKTEMDKIHDFLKPYQPSQVLERDKTIERRDSYIQQQQKQSTKNFDIEY